MRRLKNEKFGDFIIKFYGDNYISAESFYMGARVGVTYGKTKAEAFEGMKKKLRKNYPLQTRKKG